MTSPTKSRRKKIGWAWCCRTKPGSSSSSATFVPELDVSTTMTQSAISTFVESAGSTSSSSKTTDDYLPSLNSTYYFSCSINIVLYSHMLIKNIGHTLLFKLKLYKLLNHTSYLCDNAVIYWCSCALSFGMWCPTSLIHTKYNNPALDPNFMTSLITKPSPTQIYGRECA